MYQILEIRNYHLSVSCFLIYFFFSFTTRDSYGDFRIDYLYGNNTWVFEKVNLHDTKVVIDGNNLYHFIFFKYNVDFVHGGDYDQFAIRIKEFFSILHACKIQPYVVIDGGYEPDDKKFQTILDRMQKRLELATRLAKGHQEKLMPILAYETFFSNCFVRNWRSICSL